MDSSVVFDFLEERSYLQMGSDSELKVQKVIPPEGTFWTMKKLRFRGPLRRVASEAAFARQARQPRCYRCTLLSCAAPQLVVIHGAN